LLPGHAACPVGYDKIGTHCYAYHKDSRQVKNVHNLAKYDQIRGKIDQIFWHNLTRLLKNEQIWQKCPMWQNLTKLGKIGEKF
jgi:hypothetical protein